MNFEDHLTSIEQLKKRVRQIVQERSWERYHTPKNLSMKLVEEVAELMEFFIWCDNGKESFEVMDNQREAIEQELADVCIVLLHFANACGIDVARAVSRKIPGIEAKYPK